MQRVAIHNRKSGTLAVPAPFNCVLGNNKGAVVTLSDQDVGLAKGSKAIALLVKQGLLSVTYGEVVRLLDPVIAPARPYSAVTNMGTDPVFESISGPRAVLDQPGKGEIVPPSPHGARPEDQVPLSEYEPLNAPIIIVAEEPTAATAGIASRMFAPEHSVVITPQEPIIAPVGEVQNLAIAPLKRNVHGAVVDAEGDAVVAVSPTPLAVVVDTAGEPVNAAADALARTPTLSEGPIIVKRDIVTGDPRRVDPVKRAGPEPVTMVEAEPVVVEPAKPIEPKPKVDPKSGRRKRRFDGK